MSVINKMLRDLDQRQAGQPGRSASALSGGRVAMGTLPVKTLPLRSQGATPWHAVWVVLLLLVAGGSWWWYQQSSLHSAALPDQFAAVQVVQVAQVTPLASASTPIEPLSVGIAEAGVIKPAAVATSVPTAVSEKEAGVSTKVPAPVLTVSKPGAIRASASKLLPITQTPVAVAVPNTETGTLRMASSLMQLPMPKKVAPQSAVSFQAAVASQAVVARPVALEAVVQARSLWNAGSHAAATELLSQALSRLERDHAPEVAAAGQSPLTRSARELARMQLADGQVSQALALLKRLEPQLAQVADVWAMRGNAAQRLGQHPEAAESYQKALTLKPDEPRWMLGAAVSLAAQGQTAAAGDLTERARVMGALRPDVANYLRQLGVSVHTD